MSNYKKIEAIARNLGVIPQVNQIDDELADNFTYKSELDFMFNKNAIQVTYVFLFLSAKY